MGLRFIPYQNVSFVLNGEKDFNQKNYDCKGDPREFCQLAHADYPTQFQMILTPDTGEELITNGTFDTDLSGWTQSGTGSWTWVNNNPFTGGTGIARGLTFNSASIILEQANAFAITPGDQFMITIDVCSTVGGDGTGGLYVTVLANSTGLPAGVITGVGSDSNPITGQGTYTFTFESTTTDNADVQIVLYADGYDSVGTDVCSISIMSVTIPQVTLQDCNGNEIDTIEDIVYNDEYATVTVDWTPYEPGCYKICVFPEQDTGENLFGDLLCIEDELGNPILDENDNCIQAPL